MSSKYVLHFPDYLLPLNWVCRLSFLSVQFIVSSVAKARIAVATRDADLRGKEVFKVVVRVS